jgi:hypothetical protein
MNRRRSRGEFAHQLGRGRMHARRHRRLVAVENLVIRKILGHISDVPGNTGCHDQKQHGPNPEEISNQSYHQPATVCFSC